MCTLPEVYPGIINQGLAWTPNLSVSDPYYVLPVLTASMNYYNIINNTNRNTGMKMMQSL